MPVDFLKARDFIYRNGVLWERALFGHLFEGRAVEPVQRALLAYKNSDNGFGNGLEHDLKAPDSNTAAVEFLLMVLARTGIATGDLLDGAVHWLEMHRNDDGSFWSPAAISEYPIMPWWKEWGGQPAPDSITGNLIAVLGNLANHSHMHPALQETTRAWAEANLTVEKIHSVDWLFMNYHAYDYFFNDYDFPNVEEYQEATIVNILRCAEQAPDKQHYVFFNFAPTPHSPVALATDEALIQRFLDTLENSQQEDGGWRDEHGLAQWFPWVTICNLLTLRAYGRLE
jgi:hypothetical protein